MRPRPGGPAPGTLGAALAGRADGVAVRHAGAGILGCPRTPWGASPLTGGKNPKRLTISAETNRSLSFTLFPAGIYFPLLSFGLAVTGGDTLPRWCASLCALLICSRRLIRGSSWRFSWRVGLCV